MTNDAGGHPETERYSMADLAADAADVRRLLDLRSRIVELPAQRHVVALKGDIPDRALALVADLDSYGD